MLIRASLSHLQSLRIFLFIALASDARFRLASWSIILGLTLSGCVQSERPMKTTPKTVFVIVDGIPADLIERLSTPAIDSISAQGGYTRAYVGGAVGQSTESPTVSAVGYLSLITGTWANKHGVRQNYGITPNYQYWDIFRAAKHSNPDLVTGIYSTWIDNRKVLIGNGKPEAGGDKLDIVVDGFEVDPDFYPELELIDRIQQVDARVVAEAASSLKNDGPDLSWVYLQHTDDIGHRFGDSDRMDEAVLWMDQQIGRLWAAIQAREAQYSDEDWLVIVTTDHGRDAQTGRDHGGHTERERTIWIVTNGDNLAPAFYARPAMIDIYPTIVDHMDLRLPDAIVAGLEGASLLGD